MAFAFTVYSKEIIVKPEFTIDNQLSTARPDIETYIKEKNIPLFYETADCESWHFALNVLSGEQLGDGGLARGVFQFHLRTFNWFKELSGMKGLQYGDNYDQTDLAAWAFKNGYAYQHWTCYRLKGGK